MCTSGRCHEMLTVEWATVHDSWEHCTMWSGWGIKSKQTEIEYVHYPPSLQWGNTEFSCFVLFFSRGNYLLVKQLSFKHFSSHPPFIISFDYLNVAEFCGSERVTPSHHLLLLSNPLALHALWGSVSALVPNTWAQRIREQSVEESQCFGWQFYFTSTQLLRSLSLSWTGDQQTLVISSPVLLSGACLWTEHHLCFSSSSMVVSFLICSFFIPVP